LNKETNSRGGEKSEHIIDEYWKYYNISCG